VSAVVAPDAVLSFGDVATLSIADGVGLIEIDHPPVNALSAVVRKSLASSLSAALADPDVLSIVIACAGRSFFVGADIAEFGKPFEDPDVPTLVAALEASPKPLVAAIHGTALGGGFEIALACHYRIVADSARVGLPEVHLGILPGAGGTQRVPRLIGAMAAFEMLTSGRQVGAAEALTLGLVDAVVPHAMLRDDAVRHARRMIAMPLSRVSEQSVWTTHDRSNMPAWRATLDTSIARSSQSLARSAIADAIEAAVFRPFAEGLDVEAGLCAELMASAESKRLCAKFFGERKNK
jgi:3-hydroxyacyl-CoA dehydrogenase